MRKLVVGYIVPVSGLDNSHSDAISVSLPECGGKPARLSYRSHLRLHTWKGMDIKAAHTGTTGEKEAYSIHPNR